MTTIAEPRPLVTGGVDTHLDMHVAAVLSAVGGVLGTAEFPTTAAGYRRLLTWMRSFGDVDRVGVEGTGTYGVSLARRLRDQQVTVVEVMRPNRQVRRRYGKTEVVDAIAAARAVLSSEATATPKTHDGAVEALRALKVLQRSATNARTQAINQLRSLLVTAPDELRARLRDLPQRDLLATCAGFRVAADDDSPGSGCRCCGQLQVGNHRPSRFSATCIKHVHARHSSALQPARPAKRLGDAVDICSAESW